MNIKNSLAQSNKREDGHVIRHADDEDEPEREGKVLDVGQLDDFPYMRHTNTHTSLKHTPVTAEALDTRRSSHRFCLAPC